MKKIEHPLFTLEIPDFFDVTQQETIVFVAESESKPYNHQKSRLKVYLDKLDDLDSSIYKGETLEEKWEDYCLYFFKSQKMRAEKTTEKGYKIWKMHAKTDAVFQKEHYKVQYFFATAFLDDTYFLHVEIMYENDTPWDSENWVAQTYNSLQVIGNKENRDTAFRLHLVEAEEAEIEYQKKQQERIQEAEEGTRKKEYPIEIPADGKEYFKVGDFNFEFVLEETLWQIGSFSKDLNITLKAKTNDVEKAVKNQLLDDYKPDGSVTINIPAKGIHKNSTPTGQIKFEEEKSNAPLFLHAGSEGFDYRLAFNGVVTLKDGWVLLSGEMTKSYHNKSFPIQVAKKFDSSTLNWNDYQFTSMEEVATARNEKVRFLSLQNPNFIKLPEAIFTFENLEDFTIQQKTCYGNNEKLPLDQIQEEIGQLKQLKKIYVNGAALKTLPESISNLSNLEQLSVGNCLLEAIPEGVFKLSKLKYLWLGKNRLTQIPEEVNLPSLENLSLNGNQLKRLPATLAEQPKMRKIDLQDNPWVALPENLNAIEAIELSMEDKLRLLDFDYKGADGTGIISWDDSLFYSLGDTDLQPEIDAVIKNNKLSDKSEALGSLVKKAIGFTHTVEEDYSTVGNHRFGGMPDLPERIPYPRFGNNWREDKEDYIYEFLGQINCEEIAHLQDYLPRTGMLFFFLETIHSIYGGNNNPAKVIHCEDISTLLSGKRFQFTTDDYSEMSEAAYTPYKIKANKINSAPSFYASRVNKHLFLGKADKLKDDNKLLNELYDSFERPMNEANSFQYAVNSYGFTQHEAPELQASLTKKGKPEDWMTLLVVTSAGDMQWGDAGDLFFVIHKSDLAKGDFSNVFVTMESS